MSMLAKATIEDLYQAPAKAELVNGEVVLVSLTGGKPGRAGGKIFASLNRYEDTVRVYRADRPDQPTNYRRGQIAEAEPAVPGWTLAVDELFK
jgi:Uma2 family endonuclease